MKQFDGSPPFYFERYDAIRESFMQQSKTRHTRRRQDNSLLSNQSSFAQNKVVKINKGKKFLLQEERNTQIQRSNRILHEKIAKCALRSRPNSIKASKLSCIQLQQSKINSALKPKAKKIKTVPSTLPVLQQKYRSRENNISKSQVKGTMTLFMGHSKIDGVDFKVKIVISQAVYYLIAQNQHTKIILEMPESEYWALHYQQFEENPCNIFPYLQINKGQVLFRVQSKQRKKSISQQINKMPKSLHRKHYTEQEKAELQVEKLTQI